LFFEYSQYSKINKLYKHHRRHNNYYFLLVYWTRVAFSNINTADWKILTIVKVFLSKYEAFKVLKQSARAPMSHFALARMWAWIINAYVVGFVRPWTEDLWWYARLVIIFLLICFFVVINYVRRRYSEWRDNGYDNKTPAIYFNLAVVRSCTRFNDYDLIPFHNNIILLYTHVTTVMHCTATADLHRLPLSHLVRSPLLYTLSPYSYIVNNIIMFAAIISPILF